jgi:FkbM family methyltransferase
MARSGTFRSFVKSRPVQLWIQTSRGRRVVRQSGRFVLGQLIGDSNPRRYGVRGSRLDALVRHRTPDIFTLNEIFYAGIYDFPKPAIEALVRLRRSPRALDLGANIGLFGVHFFQHFPRTQLVAVEPDPSNAQLLERTIAVNGLEQRWRVLRACASNSSGVADLVAGRFHDSHIARPGETGTMSVPMVDAFELLQGVDFLKMDVEGSEWPILLDPRLAQITPVVIAMDWHLEGAPSGDPRAAAESALSRAGYRTQSGLPGVLWAWRET